MTISVFRYRVYDASTDDFFVSTRMATKEKIKIIRGEIIPNTEFGVDAEFLEDGWTAKNFDPLTYMGELLEKRIWSGSN
jgi:hypothetical protein